MKRFSRSVVFWVSLALIAVIVASSVLRSGPDREDLDFTEFRTQLDEGNVSEVEVLDRDNALTGKLDDDTLFRTTYVAEAADELVLDLEAAEVDFKVNQQRDSIWITLLFNLLPILFLVGIFLFLINSMQGGGKGIMQFGKAKTRQMSKDQPQVTFSDVAGADEAVEELREIKDFLEAPAKFHAIGAKIPKGVLLYGPPGTGKTLLARAVAGEAGVPFFTISGSDFVEMFVGVGASRVRDLFEQAKAAAPAIIFVDEIDAVGRHRGAGLGGGHDEREQTLNQLLVEMDGFDVTTGVILIAATNRPDILDPALLRPGRFDRQIVVDRPDLEGRKAIVEVHRKGKPLLENVSSEVIARRTPGFTGADLANLMNEAALLAAREDKSQIGAEEIEAAIDRVIAGPQRKGKLMTDKLKHVIAYHEAGHALVGHVLPNTDPIHKITIIPRGRALGFTLALPTEDTYLVSRAAYRDQIAMILGGRTAEEIIFGEPTTGASDDIKKATTTARAMVTEYGMSELLGPQQFGEPEGEVFLGMNQSHRQNYSEEIAATIDAEIRLFISEAHDEAREVLTLHRTTLDLLAERLIEKETLDDDDLAALWDEVGLPKGGADPQPEADASSDQGQPSTPQPTSFEPTRRPDEDKY